MIFATANKETPQPRYWKDSDKDFEPEYLEERKLS